MAYSRGALGSGCDHHGRCFSTWMAGSGIKPSIEYGAMDEIRYNIAENGVHLRDKIITVLHRLGIDYHRFTDSDLGHVSMSDKVKVALERGKYLLESVAGHLV